MNTFMKTINEGSMYPSAAKCKWLFLDIKNFKIFQKRSFFHLRPTRLDIFDEIFLSDGTDLLDS